MTQGELRTALPGALPGALPTRGRFISFEGIDGAGKSTHIDTLESRLCQRGHDVVRTREPGGSPLAEQLRELLLHQPMDALTESLLVFAARRDHLQQCIEPALARGAIVLCDRFTDSSFAYQGAGRGFELSTLRQLEAWVQQGRQPDLTLWFDLPPALAAERRAAVRAADRFEQQDEAFFVRVREGYALRMTQAPERFARVDAGVERQQVWQQIERTLEQRAWW